MATNKNLIRNFSIIAHIDHGKSTLADRLLELTGTVSKRELKEQLLDSMDLERERGITIKLNAVQLQYVAKDHQQYCFNLIDTPGHVDFTYEVSRSLAACEGALLVVDATQGIQAQTLANVYLAIDNDLTIIPVINKVDLPNAEPERIKQQIRTLTGIAYSHIPLISAKTGLNVDEVLETIVRDIPAPIKSQDDAPLQALIFDSYYDQYRGVMIFIRVFQGTVKPNDKIRFMATKGEYEVISVGIKTPLEVQQDAIYAGQVGWVAAGIKNIKDVQVGDTMTHADFPTLVPLSGYRKINSMVYCGLYSVDSSRYEDLKDALSKLQLSDAALVYEPENSQALGFGFRCGFLGLLHMDVIQERLEREYNLDLIATAPSVIYEVHLTDQQIITVDNPSKLPEVQKIRSINEPFVKVTMMTPETYLGGLMELCQQKRGIYQNLVYVDDTRRILTYEMPLNEIIFDFFDRLKSVSKGYASLDYELLGYRPSKLVKMDILLNGAVVDALSMIVHKDFAYARGRNLCAKLKDIIPQQNFEIPVQASIGNKIIARETIKALRKNVTAKCYGGDINRKKKLLEKQKKGKKRMKAFGNVELPQEAFMAVLSIDDK